MSWLSPKVPDTSPGAPERRAYDYQGPLPVVTGRFRVAGKHVEDPWNRFALSTGNNAPDAQYYSMALLFCHGRIDRVDSIIVNGQNIISPFREYGDEMSGGSPLPYFDLDSSAWLGSGYGGAGFYPLRFRFYYGTDDQPAEPFLTGAGQSLQRNDGNLRYSKFLSPAPNFHPPYAGLSYMVWYAYETGLPTNNTREGGTALPTVEIIGYRQSKFFSFANDNNAGINPIAAEYEILKDKVYGAGLPDDIIPPAAWEEKANYFDTNGYHIFPSGWDAGLSVVLANARPAGETLAKIAEHFDGFFRAKNGQLLPDYFGNRGDLIPPKNTLVEVTNDDLLEFPEIDPPDVQLALTEASVKYHDNEDDLAEQTLTERNSVPLLNRGDPNAENIEGPYYRFSRPARARAQRALSESERMKIRIRALKDSFKDSGEPLAPGDFFVFNYPDLQIDRIFRILTMRPRSAIGVEVVAMAEPNGYDSEYSAPEDVIEVSELEEPEEITNLRIIQVPPRYINDYERINYWIIAERPNSSVIGARVFRSSDGEFDGEEERVGDLRSFAGRNQLASSISDSDTDLLLNRESEDAQIFRSTTETERDNYHFLLLIDNELLLWTGYSEPGGADLQLSGLQRGVLGTNPSSHSANADVYVFQPAAMPVFTLPADRAIEGTTQYRLLSYTPTELSDTASASITVPAPVMPLPPVPTGINVKVSGNGVDLSWAPSRFATGYRIYVTEDDSLSSPTSAELYAEVSGTTVYYRNVRPGVDLFLWIEPLNVLGQAGAITDKITTFTSWDPGITRVITAPPQQVQVVPLGATWEVGGGGSRFYFPVPAGPVTKTFAGLITGRYVLENSSGVNISIGIGVTFHDGISGGFPVESFWETIVVPNGETVRGLVWHRFEGEMTFDNDMYAHISVGYEYPQGFPGGSPPYWGTDFRLDGMQVLLQELQG